MKESRFPDPTPKKKKRDGTEEQPSRAESTPYHAVLSWFSKGNTVETSDEMPFDEYMKCLEKVQGLKELVAHHLDLKEGDGVGLGMEFVLEGLHQHSMVSKREEGAKVAYRDMLKAMFDHMAQSED